MARTIDGYPGRRTLWLLLFAGCATSQATQLIPDGGAAASSSGAGGMVTLTSTGSGLGGEIGVGGQFAAGGTFGAGGGLDAGPDVDASACAAFVETFMPACNFCLDVNCCDVASACFAVSDCFGFASCQQNCPAAPFDGGSNPCLDACTQSYPMAQPAFGALAACLHASCAGSCPY
jgi:hypothetical protein